MMMIKSNYDALQSLYDNVTKEFDKYQKKYHGTDVDGEYDDYILGP